MDQNTDGRTVQIMTFTVRNDKYRGIVIEKVATENNEYYFKYQDQHINRHCEQMKRIIRLLDVKCTKTVRVDVAEFSHEYYHKNIVTFKGCPLTSVSEQIENVCASAINKKVGAMKRKITVAENKQKKIEEQNQKDEQHFHEQHARRIHDLFIRGVLKAPQALRVEDVMDYDDEL